MRLQFHGSVHYRWHDDHIWQIAYAAGVKSVKVIATRPFVEAAWRVDWNDEAAVIRAFNRHKFEHLEAAARAEDTGRVFREYKID